MYNDLLLAADSGHCVCTMFAGLDGCFRYRWPRSTYSSSRATVRSTRYRRGLLQWFRSYLSDRSYQVIYGDNTSSTVYITRARYHKVRYLARVSSSRTRQILPIVEKHDVNLHAYADDTQLYLKCFRDEMTFAATRLEHCLTDVSRWMSANRFKLSSEKTELVWVGSKMGTLR